MNPVRGGSPAATARKLGTVLPPLPRKRKDLPAELCAALDRALSPRPEDRGTLDELADELAAGLHRRLRRGRHDPRPPARAPAHGPAAAASPAGSPARWPPAGSPRPRRALVPGDARDRARRGAGAAASPSPRCPGSAGWRASAALAFLLARGRPAGDGARAARRRGGLRRRSCAGRATPGRCPPPRPCSAWRRWRAPTPRSPAAPARWWQRAGARRRRAVVAAAGRAADRRGAAVGRRGRRGLGGRRRRARSTACCGRRWPPAWSLLAAPVGARRAAAARGSCAGATPGVDFVAASAWAAGLGAGTAAIAEWAGATSPRGLVAGAIAAGALAWLLPRTAPAGYRGTTAAMSVLRNLESKLAGLVEGTFSRAFKSEVRPVEIARKLTREMEEHKVQSLSRTYAPNEYAVWLSPDDRKQFEGYERDLATELSGYLLEHARRERIALVTSPKISFSTDDRLRLGEFGIQARLVRPAEDDSQAPEPGRRGPHDGLHGLRAARGAAARARPPARHRAPALRGQDRRAALRRRRDRPLARLRRRPLRPERLPPPRRGPPQRRQVDRQATSAPPTASRSTAAASHGAAVAQVAATRSSSAPRPSTSSWSNRWPWTPSPSRSSSASSPCCTCSCCGWPAPRMKDLRRGGGAARRPRYADDATGMHVASAGLRRRRRPSGDPKLRVETAAGLRAGSAYSLAEGAVLGRGDQADIQLRTRSPRRSTHGSRRTGTSWCWRISDRRTART